MRRHLRPLLGRVRLWTRHLTRAGRAVLTLGTTCLGLAPVTGFVELEVLGWMCVVLLAIAAVLVLLPVRADGRLDLQPPRSVAGESVRASVTLHHRGGPADRQPLVGVPCRGATTWLRLPALLRGAVASESWRVDTPRRGVVGLGPVVHVRTDPLGLLRLERAVAPARELYVRPAMVSLGPLEVGQARDVEGTASDQVSMSNLAFHALREYVPGDDLRHVHWRSSARAGELLVRQYHDSRRDQTTVVLDTARSSYGTDDELELAASVAASLVARAASDDAVLNLLAGEERHSATHASALLDGLCRAGLGEHQVAADVESALHAWPDTSVLVVVTGSGTHVEQVAGALWSAPHDVVSVVLRAVPGAASAFTVHSGREVLTVGRLADLPRLVAAGR